MKFFPFFFPGFNRPSTHPQPTLIAMREDRGRIVPGLSAGNLRLPILWLALMLGLTILHAQQTPLPISSYDYLIPENNVSPITMGTGAINLINSDDPYAAFSNPALMADNELSSFSLSFRLKNEDDIAYWEAVNISNALKAKQFKYFVLNTKQVSFAYQPVAGVHISEFSASGDSSRYYDYQLDKLQFSIGAKDKKYQKLGAGLNVKYLSGRLIYLAEHRLGNLMVRDGFIDDKVKGVSADLGFTYTVGNIVYAGTFYDLLSRLWWENYDPVSLQRRSSLGMGWKSGNSTYTAGVQNKISKTPDTTYHLGYGYQWNWGTNSGSTSSEDPSATRQTMDIRMGLYSHDFYGANNINYTFGGGYYYKTIRFDFSLNNSGLHLADSEYLFALSLGI